MNMKKIIACVFLLAVAQVEFMEARCRGFAPKCWAREARKGLEKAAEETARAAEETARAAEETRKAVEYAARKTAEEAARVARETQAAAELVARETQAAAELVARETQAAAEQLARETQAAAEQVARETKAAAEKVGREVEKAGGVVAQAGVTVGNVTINEIEKGGKVVVSVAGKAGSTVLKTGQAVVTSAGMTLLNAGGVIIALTTGDLDKLKSCAGAVSSGVRYGLATVVDETLKAVGSLDKVVTLRSVSFAASSSELALQGKTPKMSIAGSFLGKNFTLKDVQLDLSSPDKFVAGIFAVLVQLK